MAKTQRKETVGVRAAKLAQDTAKSLHKGAEAVTGGISAVTTGKAQVQGAVVDAKQARGITGSKTKLSEVVLSEDTFGGLAVPEVDLGGMIPTDLINPAIAPQRPKSNLHRGLRTTPELHAHRSYTKRASAT